MQKSLLDIQQEIRDVEQQVNALSNSIAEIYKDVAILRNEEITLIDYKKIQLLSTYIKFENHPLANLTNKKLCQAYIELLLRLVHLDKDVEPTINRLVFVQWLVKQAKLDLGLEKLFEGALKRDQDNLIFIMESLPASYNNHLIMDLLLIANISGKANEEILAFVGDLCSFLNVNKDKLKAFSVIAKSILQQNTDIIKDYGFSDILLYAKQFEYYLGHNVLLQSTSKQHISVAKSVLQYSERNVASRTMSERRVLVAKIYDNSYYDMIWIRNTGYYLDEGDIICTYRDFRKVNDSNKCVIEAPCEGQLYIFREGNITYVLIHHEKDNISDVRAWALVRSEQHTIDTKSVLQHSDRNIASLTMSERRVLVAKIYDNSCYDIIWIRNTGYYLDEGDVICTYRDFRKVNDSNKCVIEAPCEGQLYIFKESNITYVVIHHEKDNPTEVKVWARSRR